MRPVNRRELRRWVRVRRAGAEKERELMRGERPLPPDVALARALDLIDFTGSIVGWPFPETEVGRREAEEARRTWRRLQRRLTGR